ncbi:MAG: hypothetical protein WC934_02960 [Acidithiobacillus sp.]|jgi:hypothetical protein|uniref:hypothetical protein n=1 Tax=Acidithiobacillus sp. TaxID=1872118 RepID=UPI0035602CC8
MDCSDKTIQKKAKLLAEYEEEMNDLQYQKEEHGLNSDDRSNLEYKSHQYDKIFNEIKKCRKNPNDEIYFEKLKTNKIDYLGKKHDYINEDDEDSDEENYDFNEENDDD